MWLPRIELCSKLRELNLYLQLHFLLNAIQSADRSQANCGAFNGNVIPSENAVNP